MAVNQSQVKNEKPEKKTTMRKKTKKPFDFMKGAFVVGIVAIILLIWNIIISFSNKNIVEALNYGFNYGYESAVKDYTMLIAETKLDVANLKKFKSKIKFAENIYSLYKINILEEWEEKQIDEAMKGIKSD